jgi:hypothetical protein
MGNVIIDFKQNIFSSIDEMKKDLNHRYRSWDHCYYVFQNLPKSPTREQLVFSSLNLAFFLASWGMYRGSSQLLQKDYLVHLPILIELIKNEYYDIKTMDYDSVNQDSHEVKTIYDLMKQIHLIYSKSNISPTHTLITKVLLCTFGCIPAYDTFFINGIDYWNRKLNIESSKRIIKYFGINSYISLINFYQNNKSEILDTQKEVINNGFNYPIMKLIDMYFWNLGFQSINP